VAAPDGHALNTEAGVDGQHRDAARVNRQQIFWAFVAATVAHALKLYGSRHGAQFLDAS